ncbi:acyl-CoA thioesterase [Streptomyces albipurpureus]|uniref:Thioesterase family protein n=1 Tax=Streptomyces albipurpureus TaxID=2897419 RepID=A0ABT0V077_9ACTN|nr:acyl-CoA thioesterase domain-containing protein [Streptomyces sp. CWNU-1]MCM2393891.1 thioesterase family protein [Streptomyces sp. CWNU-1]
MQYPLTNAAPTGRPDNGDADLVRFLALERLDRDLFSGMCHRGGTGRAFGGHLAAQALAAAGHTVDADRRVHSLHGYFLRPGELHQPMLYHVERLRDGRSYGARRVTAFQGGEAVFTLSASFKSPEDTADRQRPMPSVPAPEELPDPYPMWARTRPKDFAASVYRRVVSMRVVPRSDRPGPPAPSGVTEYVLWMRAVEPLPDDATLHGCALTYASDLAPGAVAAMAHEEPRMLRSAPDRVFTASLDHSMWFHRPFRADEWLLFVVRSPSESDGRGLATGKVWTREGELAASFAQEVVVRPLPPAS